MCTNVCIVATGHIRVCPSRHAIMVLSYQTILHCIHSFFINFFCRNINNSIFVYNHAQMKGEYQTFCIHVRCGARRKIMIIFITISHIYIDYYLFYVFLYRTIILIFYFIYTAIKYKYIHR